jgi:alpha-methylacyl-CoA racemase
MKAAGTVSGALQGIRVIELASIGPVPFGCMMLGDMGADVVRIDRVDPVELGTQSDPRYNILNRNRRSLALNLKHPRGLELARSLITNADVVIEGYRPGVAERLGLGPLDCQSLNPRLIYARVTGWGQEGPLTQQAGHDINYIALTGLLGMIGKASGPPVPPLNLIGDFGGGALYLVVGVLAALLERSRSGQGQVIDVAMVDGVFSLMSAVFGADARGAWIHARESNPVDGGSPFYGVYETLDAKYIALGAIEKRFQQRLADLLGVAMPRGPADHTSLRQELTRIFRTRTRDDWTASLMNHDVCFTPVLNLREALRHPHNSARKVTEDWEGVLQPSPAPRFSRTPSQIRQSPALPGQNTDELLAECGCTTEEIDSLRALGAVG